MIIIIIFLKTILTKEKMLRFSLKEQIEFIEKYKDDNTKDRDMFYNISKSLELLQLYMPKNIFSANINVDDNGNDVKNEIIEGIKTIYDSFIFDLDNLNSVNALKENIIDYLSSFKQTGDVKNYDITANFDNKTNTIRLNIKFTTNDD